MKIPPQLPLNKLLRSLVCALTAVLLVSPAFAQCFTSRSSGEINLALQKLKIAGSVLFIAAHPDDENSALLAYLARGQLLRTGYLALNRGEGGQNIIGSEKGVALGVLRTSELLEARRIDNAEQYFTRAYDFGYSKSAEETLTHWNREDILGDVVWNIRRFRPDIIVTRFPITGEGRHGHHTASAILGEEAFAAAADKNRFPEQLQFVDTWRTNALLQNEMPAKWNPNFSAEGKIALDIGQFNTALGKSYGELAAESRSKHKSQGFGTAADAESRMEYFTARFGSRLSENPFDAGQFSISRFGGSRALISAIDRAIEINRRGEGARSLFEALLRIRPLLSSISDRSWRELKTLELDRLLLDVSGAKLEALADRPAFAAGEMPSVHLSAMSRTDSGIKLCSTSATWSEDSGAAALTNSRWTTIDHKLTIPAGFAASNLYWLEQPMKDFAFGVADRRLIGLPFSPPAVTAQFKFCTEDQEFSWSCPLQHKSLDQRDGDRYQTVSIFPTASITFDLNSVFAAKGKSAKVTLEVESFADNLSGSLRFVAPPGWTVNPAALPIRVGSSGESAAVSIEAFPGKSAAPGILTAELETADGTKSAVSLRTVAYPHIESHSYLQPAQIALSTAAIELPRLRIGYIPGAGDEVAQSLSTLGYSVQILSDAELRRGNLSGFDSIVVGVRALNVKKEWSSFYPQLMEFVSRGGTLIVQYSANDFLSKVPPKIGPYPFELTSGRVTDENAEVTFRDPLHPLLNYPNKITQEDFKGWVQERGIYFAGNLDSHYSAPLEMHDQNESPLSGALIAAQYGKGHFIYTGLVFFRELPAGVPGAYRLFANLLNYGHHREH